MPNLLDATGLQTASREELIAKLTAGYQAIYGVDINLASDSPDGQMMNLFVQMLLDNSDLLVQIYNSFDPDNAFGVVLDQRVAINGIQRQAGTHTVTPITVVTNQSVNLYGLDQSVQPVYTVADNAGNKWLLQSTELGTGVGSSSLLFQAENPGAQLTTPNTITVPVTVVLGVTTVNNPASYLILGINEETDGNLKVRRQRSTALSSVGYYEGLLAALENINGVTSAYIYENDTDTTDADGTPSHSIWIIVAGTGDPAEIGAAIYQKRNAGCGMRGDETYAVVRPSGTPFVARWDNVILQNLFVVFTLTSIDGVTQPNTAAIRAGLPAIYQPGVNQELDINGLGTFIQQIDPNALMLDAGFSTGLVQNLYVNGTPVSGSFKVNYAGNASALINWNDNVATIQTKIRAVAGLSTATVVGTALSGVIEVTLTSSPLYNINDLLLITNNTLVNFLPSPIVITVELVLSNTLAPNSKQKKFVLTPENIVITPLRLNPPTSAVASGAAITFVASGGYGTYAYAININNSGATINSVTGAYVAGPTPGSDQIYVLDALRNVASATVVVV